MSFSRYLRASKDLNNELTNDTQSKDPKAFAERRLEATHPLQCDRAKRRIGRIGRVGAPRDRDHEIMRHDGDFGVVRIADATGGHSGSGVVSFNKGFTKGNWRMTNSRGQSWEGTMTKDDGKDHTRR